MNMKSNLIYKRVVQYAHDMEEEVYAKQHYLAIN